MYKYWLLLLAAILLEVTASTCLKYSAGFKVLPFAWLALILYAGSFYILSIVLVYIPFGVAYAIWSGLGILCVTLISVWIYKDSINLAGYIGIAVLSLGVVITCLSTLERGNAVNQKEFLPYPLGKNKPAKPGTSFPDLL